MGIVMEMLVEAEEVAVKQAKEDFRAKVVAFLRQHSENLDAAAHANSSVQRAAVVLVELAKHIANNTGGFEG